MTRKNTAIKEPIRHPWKQQEPQHTFLLGSSEKLNITITYNTYVKAIKTEQSYITYIKAIKQNNHISHTLRPLNRTFIYHIRQGHSTEQSYITYIKAIKQNNHISHTSRPLNRTIIYHIR